MKKIYYILILVSLCQTMFGQKVNMSQKLADKEYANLHYSDAAELYEQSLKKDSNNTETIKKLADCYFKTRESVKAERAYRKLINMGFQDTEVTLGYAESLARNGKYEEARFYYDKYDAMMPEDKRGAAFAKSYENLSKLYSDSARYKIYYLNINTQQADFSPVPYKDGLVFTSARVQGNGVKRVYGWNNTAYLDMYFVDTNNVIKSDFYTPIIADDVDTSTYLNFKEKNPLHADETRKTSNDTRTVGYHGHYFKSDNKLSKDSSLLITKPFSKKLNTKYHEGPCAFDGDSVIYFTRNNYNKMKGAKSSDKVNKLKLYYSKKTNGAWSTAKEMPFNSNEYSTGHPALSADGNTLYFASDMPGSVGKTDIFKVTKNADNTWSKPENLGSDINTVGNEMFPFVDGNNNLFFSSTGHPGLGGLDIFKTPLSNANPKNMGFPLNSKKDDFGIIVSNDMKTGYFSSNRKRGGPDDDIYMFDYKPGIKLDGIVVYVENETPIDKAFVKLNDKNENIYPEKQNDFEGKFSFDGLEPEKVYYIPVKKEGFADQMAEISTVGIKPGETIQVKIYMDKPLQIALEGTLTDRETEVAQYEPITLTNKTTGETTTTKTNADGRFYFKLMPENEYEVYGTKGAIKSNIEARSTKGIKESKVITAFLYMQPLIDCDRNKQKYFIENTYYDLDKFAIRSDAKIVLDKVLNLLKAEPDLALEFSSHTDSRASGTYNQRLALRRSNAVLKYFTENGIDIARLTLLVSKDPVQGCTNPQYCDEAKQQSGRRTSYSFIKGGVNQSKLRCKEGMIALTGKAFSSETLQPMDNVKVVLKDKTDGSVIAQTLTAANGLYAFEVKPNKEYVVEALKDSCADNIQFVITKNIKTKTINIDSPLLCEGDKIKLEKIFFDLGKYNIRPDAGKELDKVIKTMNKYPKLRIKLGSHTDSRGSEESNRTLSSNRAKSSAEYIIKKGKFDPSRIEYEGYGESRPVNKCVDGVKCTNAEYQQNRRTEMEILSVH